MRKGKKLLITPGKYTIRLINQSIDLSSDEFKELIVKYRNGDNDALDTIFRGLYKLVATIISKNMNILRIWEESYDDTFQTLLMVAKEKVIDKYDLNNDASLTTYLYSWLNLTMKCQLPMYLSDKLSIIRQERGYERKPIVFIDDLSDWDKIMFKNKNIVFNDYDEAEITDENIIDAIMKLKDNEIDYFRKVYGINIIGYNPIKRRTSKKTYMERFNVSYDEMDRMEKKLKSVLIRDL